MESRIKTLLFTKTSGYRHTCIPAMTAALSSLTSVDLTHTESLSELQDLLPSHDVLVLGHNTGDFLDEDSLAAIKNFVERQGTGVVGIHACTAGMLESEWYAALLGARFEQHPEPQWGKIKIHFSNKEEARQGDHFILQGLPVPSSSSVPGSAAPRPESLNITATSSTDFPWFDEWYNFKATPRVPPKGSTILISVDPATYEGWAGQDGDRPNGPHPLAWCHEAEMGETRVFYNALGHFDEAYRDPWFMGMLERGIWWTARRGK